MTFRERANLYNTNMHVTGGKNKEYYKKCKLKQQCEL